MPAPRKTAALHATFRGRVQGVGFRAFVTGNANELNVRGWVRNRLDGSVEAQLVGEGPAINELLRRCRKGPPGASVDSVNAEPSDVPEPEPEGFGARSTI
ncbi:MAG: acylphosphatase [Minwuia sp.]|uniref:acylphosphatase n=1 Tax=Minwuia sp. TaxID=2493630 RepID=UPI003A8737AD